VLSTDGRESEVYDGGASYCMMFVLSLIPVHQIVRTLLGDRRIDMLIPSAYISLPIVEMCTPVENILYYCPLFCWAFSYCWCSFSALTDLIEIVRSYCSYEIEDSHGYKNELYWLLNVTPFNLVDIYLSVTEICRLILYLKYGDSKFLLNFSRYLPDNTSSHHSQLSCFPCISLRVRHIEKRTKLDILYFKTLKLCGFVMRERTIQGRYSQNTDSNSRGEMDEAASWQTDTTLSFAFTFPLRVHSTCRRKSAHDCYSVPEAVELSRNLYLLSVVWEGPPLWSSCQSSWLQIRRPGFDSRHYQKKVVGLERGSLSLVSTTEELLDRKVAAPV
jgi:hypothetical protein